MGELLAGCSGATQGRGTALDQQGALELSVHLQPHLSVLFNPDTKATAGNKAESPAVGPMERGDRPQDKLLLRVGSRAHCASCPQGGSF